VSASDTTVPKRSLGVPVRTLHVSVVAGPDTGAIRSSADEPITVGTAPGNTLTVNDRTVSRYHLELTRSQDRVRVVDLGSTNGTLIGPVLLHDGVGAVAVGSEIRIGQSVLSVTDGELVTVNLEHRTALGTIRGNALAMQQLMDTVEQLAGKAAPVLLLGESGTGKELIARALHDLGPRREGAFVTVDCGAVPANLFASELFGHERGAFTGADRMHTGAFERANGGTLFLDEIGELPAEHQAALLGALERRRIRRVGGRTEIPVDVRVVSATHRDLRAEVNAGSFRLDLYYRLAVVLVRVPALRDRPEDIPMLVAHFLAEEGHPGSVESVFPRETMRALQNHRWPGNVRELRNVVTAALATGKAPELESASLATAARADLLTPLLDLQYKEARRILLDEFEARYVRYLLDRMDGNVRRAAREAGMDRSYLNDLLKRHGVR
jgi:DNA-binding NtrC family response regulator